MGPVTHTSGGPHTYPPPSVEGAHVDYKIANRTSTPAWKRTRARRRQLAQEAGQTRCPDCNVLLDWEISQMPNSAEVDHIIPHAQGGSSHIDNTRICCRKCNQSKGAKLGNQRRQTTSSPNPGSGHRGHSVAGAINYTAPRTPDGRRPGWPPHAPEAYN